MPQRVGQIVISRYFDDDGTSDYVRVRYIPEDMTAIEAAGILALAHEVAMDMYWEDRRKRRQTND